MSVLLAAVAAILLAGAAARAEPAPRAITLADAVTAAATAPASQFPREDVNAADALVDAAGAWPAPSIRVGTSSLTARLTVGATVPLPVFGTVGAAKREAAAEAEVVRAEALM